MSGTATSVQMTFLKRNGNSYSEYPVVPLATSLSYSTDVRQFSGAFDFEIELGNGESFLPRSHDVVEFWIQVDGFKQPIGVGFLEDFVDDSDEKQTNIKANGRDLIGQLIMLPYISHKTYKDMTLEAFTRFTIQGTYLQDYLKFRGRFNPILDQGAYSFPLLVVTTNSLKRGAVLQNYAELAQNLIYQNPNGQIEIYGRQTEVKPLGTLIRASGKTNVNHIRKSDNFSKVISECTVEWTVAQEFVNYDKLNSTRRKNTDPRVAHIFQPETKVFSAGDLQALAGQQDAAFRVDSLAKASIRKSMANLGAITITTSEPFYRDPRTGLKTLFRTMQDWHIVDFDKGIDKTLRLAGISYTQDFSQLSVQLAFVEPDTLV
jgi:hypothetical protein